MPLQLAPPVDFSDEVVPLTSGSHTATADESQLTSTSECSESPLPRVSCSVTDNDNVTGVPPVLLSETPHTSYNQIRNQVTQIRLLLPLVLKDVTVLG